MEIEATSQMALDAAHETLAQCGTSFHQASWFLPRGVADDAAVVYRFCRAVDDAVDEQTEFAEARALLESLRRQLLGVTVCSSVIRDYLAVANRRHLTPDIADALLKGVCSDLGRVRIESVRELASYAYRVAGVVGRMMCGVLGVRNADAVQYAVDLGIAMQLTNICRDVLEDARRDRVYLPADLLARHGLSHRDIVSARCSDLALSKCVDDLLDTADALYARGRFGLRFIPLRSRIGIAIALNLYERIGLKLRRVHQSNPLHGRTVLTTLERLKALIPACFDVIASLPVLKVFRKALPSPLACGWVELAQPCRLDNPDTFDAPGNHRGHYEFAS